MADLVILEKNKKMKRLFNLGIIALLVVFSSACNKCRKLDCKNEATCEKREGVCNCNFLYTGELCEEEIRKSYVGTYDGVISFPNPSNPFKTEETDLPVNIFIQGSNANGLGVNFTFLDTRYELTGELTAEDAFTFNAQKMTVDGFGDITVLSTSNGTFNGNALNATINIRLEDLPEFPLKLTFAGSK
mgnify:FL=1|jgi:hypothetical protein|tara:strand:+ start:58490 stop:59053 length:564 start_codon:yes stop_codon:yes gene_type:complete